MNGEECERCGKETPQQDLISCADCGLKLCLPCFEEHGCLKDLEPEKEDQ